MNPAALVIVALGVVALGVLATGVKIVRPYQRGLVERLGRYKTTREPGFHFIFPFIDTMRLVDMREQVVDVPPQEVITADNVVVSVDAVVYYEATDPQRLVYNVADFFTAITKLAQTNLRNLIGDLELDTALTSRDTINTQLREVLDDATDKWGVRVVRVEIQRIDPPTEVVQAMHAQMRAERDRRATVTEANGFREAAIARAEGEKQAAVLAAEGRKQSAVLDAEGDAEAIRLRAEAEKTRLSLVGQGEGIGAKERLEGIKAADPDGATVAVEYLAALERLADGRATKLIVPADYGGLLGTLAAMGETFGLTNGAAADDSAAPHRMAPDASQRVDLPPPGAQPMATLAPAGWYPDPTGGTRLRWWDGEDWSDDYRTRPLHTFTDAIDPEASVSGVGTAAGGTIASRDIDRIVGAVQSSTRTEMDRAVGELQQAARGEVDRVVGEVRRQVGNVQPLISDTVGQITRYLRWAFVIGILLVVAYFAFQVVAGIGIAELVGDIADRIIDAVDDESSLGSG